MSVAVTVMMALAASGCVGVKLKSCGPLPVTVNCISPIKVCPSPCCDGSQTELSKNCSVYVPGAVSNVP